MIPNLPKLTSSTYIPLNVYVVVYDMPVNSMKEAVLYSFAVTEFIVTLFVTFHAINDKMIFKNYIHIILGYDQFTADV